MNELTGRTIDRAIAVALGWRVSPPIEPNGEWYGYGSGRWVDAIEPLPRWSTDANAVIAVCAERGWRLTFGRNAKGLPAATIEIWGEGFKSYSGHGATPQEAGARALLAALTGESEATA